ncbi:2-methylisocitrate lyase-like PEP mutase family enzyme [Allocatelliglobosispora scoriae]|uniref:2-methylisocitrate lyase-like PEP mutase family enzyme n=1 Tax=Allocatelliglobosispora scoriae TaxID=643052 RepID=A0A841C2T2_9ACTN|nr:isocitrate lyase/phosphoenolpyruvate mutase family protein [Allocatelliglobosispora scoriae]MBB5873270.1 2-methylisocitrate lyase-like PEP mutase family enzyme [Allocatelliglobosispora scoriae]
MPINDRAQLFRSLHTAVNPLRLANAWDVASARVIESIGATAIATTSAGVAWSLGSPDGDELDRDRALDLIARIVTAVGVPVTADIESGFGASPEAVATTIAGVLDAGAVGVNLEDSLRGGPSPLRPAQEQAERLAAARGAADETGVELYINARIDTFLRLSDPAGRLDETLSRAETYLAAGADGIFVPGVVDPTTVAALVDGIAAPLNILAGPGSPDLGALGALGVARVSLGSSIAAAAYAVARRAAEEFFTTGTYSSLAGALAYGEINELLRKHA